MRRVKAACICQTLHFMLKDKTEPTYAAKLIREEINQYKRRLDYNGTKYRVLEENEQEDGSVILKIIKQYNSSPVGDYFN